MSDTPLRRARAHAAPGEREPGAPSLDDAETQDFAEPVAPGELAAWIEEGALLPEDEQTREYLCPDPDLDPTTRRRFPVHLLALTPEREETRPELRTRGTTPPGAEPSPRLARGTESLQPLPLPRPSGRSMPSPRTLLGVASGLAACAVAAALIAWGAVAANTDGAAERQTATPPRGAEGNAPTVKATGDDALGRIEDRDTREGRPDEDPAADDEPLLTTTELTARARRAYRRGEWGVASGLYLDLADRETSRQRAREHQRRADRLQQLETFMSAADQNEEEDVLTALAALEEALRVDADLDGAHQAVLRRQLGSLSVWAAHRHLTRGDRATARVAAEIAARHGRSAAVESVLRLTADRGGDRSQSASDLAEDLQPPDFGDDL